MSSRGSDGYILASAIGVLLTISVVAASLVGASSEALSRLRRSETSTTQDAVLQSALALISSQLPLDPRRRAIDLAGEINLSVLDQRVRANIRWESNKLDINRADTDTVRQLLADRHLAAKAANVVLTTLGRARSEKRALRLISDLGLDAEAEACVASMLTVFGGRRDYELQNPGDQTLIGRPAAGSRLHVGLFIPQPAQAGLEVVVLMTGDAIRPVEVLDWKRTTGPVGEELCHDAQ